MKRSGCRGRQWQEFAIKYEQDGKLGEALYCWDQAALLGDPSGKLWGIQLRTKQVNACRPEDLPQSDSSPSPM